MNRSVGVSRLAAFFGALALVAATRLPGESTPSAVLAGLGAVVLACLASLLVFWGKAPRTLRPWAFLLSLAVLLVPPSDGAVLAWIPGWVVAFLFVLALHVFFQEESRHAPIISSHHAWGRHHVLRFLPATIAIALLLVAPLAETWLPLRMRSAYELHTALAPLAPLAVLGGLLVFGGTLRAILGHWYRAAGGTRTASAETTDASGEVEAG